MEVVFRLSTLRRLLVVNLVCVAVLGLCVEVADKLLELDDPLDLEDLFSLSHEENLPTWYSSALLLACAVALAAAGSAKRRAGEAYSRHWSALALFFAYISFDEVAQLHEEMSSWFELEGPLYYGWVVPASVAVAVLGVAYLGFLRALPNRLRTRFVQCAVLYVGGALVLELPLGWWADVFGRRNFGYVAIDLVEETLEIAGLSLFLHTLVRHLCADGLRVELASEPGSGELALERRDARAA